MLMNSDQYDIKFHEIVKVIGPEYETQPIDTPSLSLNAKCTNDNWDRTFGQLRTTQVPKKSDQSWTFYFTQVERSIVRPKIPLFADLASHEKSDSKIERERAEWVTGFSVFYRSLWLLMGIVSLAWGVILGVTVAGTGLVGPATAGAGTVITIGLMVTLLVAGRKTHTGA